MGCLYTKAVKPSVETNIPYIIPRTPIKVDSSVTSCIIAIPRVVASDPTSIVAYLTKVYPTLPLEYVNHYSGECKSIATIDVLSAEIERIYLWYIDTSKTGTDAGEYCRATIICRLKTGYYCLCYLQEGPTIPTRVYSIVVSETITPLLDGGCLGCIPGPPDVRWMLEQPKPIRWLGALRL